MPVTAVCTASTVSGLISNSGDSFLSGIESTKVTDVLQTTASDSSFHSSIQMVHAKRLTLLELRECAAVAMGVHSTVKEEQYTCTTGSLNEGMSCCSSHEMLERFHQPTNQDGAQYSLDSDKLLCISLQAADSSPQKASLTRGASADRQATQPTRQYQTMKEKLNHQTVRLRLLTGRCYHISSLSEKQASTLIEDNCPAYM